MAELSAWAPLLWLYHHPWPSVHLWHLLVVFLVLIMVVVVVVVVAVVVVVVVVVEVLLRQVPVQCPCCVALAGKCEPWVVLEGKRKWEWGWLVAVVVVAVVVVAVAVAVLVWTVLVRCPLWGWAEVLAEPLALCQGLLSPTLAKVSGFWLPEGFGLKLVVFQTHTVGSTSICFNPKQHIRTKPWTP